MNLQSTGPIDVVGSSQPSFVARTPAQGTSPSSSKSAQDSQSVATPPQKPGKEELSTMTKAVNDFVKPLNSTLQFNIDDSTGQTVVKVIDTDTKEVIKQIPSEDMLALAKALDQIKGLLVKQKA
jgi:flagellar protein FlaG